MEVKAHHPQINFYKKCKNKNNPSIIKIAMWSFV